VTTIVATAKALYSDSQCTSFPTFKTAKLLYVQCEKSGEDYLVGGAGWLSELYFMARLVEEYGLDKIWKLHLTEHWPPKILKRADTDLLVVTRDKQIFLMDRGFTPMPIQQTSYAIGSGGEYATSALALGKEPADAVAFACEHDPYSKPPVQELKFPRKKAA
jgi:hypothetical protein